MFDLQKSHLLTLFVSLSPPLSVICERMHTIANVKDRIYKRPKKLTIDIVYTANVKTQGLTSFFVRQSVSPPRFSLSAIRERVHTINEPQELPFTQPTWRNKAESKQLPLK